ncbi:MAG: TIGR01244 family sulfur transferase [Burkholderiaceae bacterium]
MRINRVNDSLSVSPQLLPGEMAAVAEAGFKTVINNRPEGEEPGQPATAEVRAAAEAAGMTFVDIPFTAGMQTAEDVHAFAQALAGNDGPILAYCRSGTRSTTVWAMSQAGKLSADEIIASAAGAGYDLSPMRPMLSKG